MSRLAWHIGAEHVTRNPTAARPQLSAQRVVDGEHCSNHAPTPDAEDSEDMQALCEAQLQHIGRVVSEAGARCAEESILQRRSTLTSPSNVFCTAYPFAFDATEAAQRASLAAILARPADVFTCLKSYFLDTEPVEPTRVAAVYLPGWIVDADVEMKMTPKQDEGDVKPVATSMSAAPPIHI